MGKYETLEKIKSQYHKLDGVSENDIKVLEVIVDAGFSILTDLFLNRNEEIIEPNVLLMNDGESFRCYGGSNVFSKIIKNNKVVYRCHCGGEHLYEGEKNG